MSRTEIGSVAGVKDVQDRLVVGVASSALFDLAESHEVFVRHGPDEYRKYQRERRGQPLSPGRAFDFAKRLLSLNDLLPTADLPIAEIIIMSRNSPETGLRVMNSIREHGLPISRAIFMEGRSPFRFARPLGMSLFLTADVDDVNEAISRDIPAGVVLAPGSVVPTTRQDDDLRIAFDFDGVLASDSAERDFRNDPETYRELEAQRAHLPIEAGMLSEFLRHLNRIQHLEKERQASTPEYRRRLYVSLVTARGTPAHERAVNSLTNWGVEVNDAFFLGGLDKGEILLELQPHIFFDDQMKNLTRVAGSLASVHIPFGVANEKAE